jgi:hypothetical protein
MAVKAAPQRELPALPGTRARAAVAPSLGRPSAFEAAGHRPIRDAFQLLQTPPRDVLGIGDGREVS